MTVERSFRRWMLGLLALIGLLMLLGGCGTVPDIGAEAQSRTVAPVTVTTDEGPVEVEATTITESEALSAGAVKADTARDIRTFGLDPGTLNLLKDVGGEAFGLGKSISKSIVAGFWKQTGVITCIMLGIGLFLLNVKLEMKETYRIILMAIGLGIAATAALQWALLA